MPMKKQLLSLFAAAVSFISPASDIDFTYMSTCLCDIWYFLQL